MNTAKENVVIVKGYKELFCLLAEAGRQKSKTIYRMVVPAIRGKLGTLVYDIYQNPKKTASEYGKVVEDSVAYYIKYIKLEGTEEVKKLFYNQTVELEELCVILKVGNKLETKQIWVNDLGNMGYIRSLSFLAGITPSDAVRGDYIGRAMCVFQTQEGRKTAVVHSISEYKSRLYDSPLRELFTSYFCSLKVDPEKVKLTSSEERYINGIFRGVVDGCRSKEYLNIHTLAVTVFSLLADKISIVSVLTGKNENQVMVELLENECKRMIQVEKLAYIKLYKYTHMGCTPDYLTD